MSRILVLALFLLPCSALFAEAAAEPQLAAQSPPATQSGGAVAVPTVEKPVDQWRADPTVSFEAVDVDLDDFKWIARPVVVFADTPRDPSFRQQMEFLASRPEALAKRDVVVLTDTRPEMDSELRQRLHPRGFALVLMGKDGQVKQRKPLPRDVREIGRSIDKMPTRREEIRQERNRNQ